MVDTVARRYLTLLAVHIIREKGFTGHPFASALTSDLEKQTMWGFVDMSHLLLLGKFEYTGGPIFKVVLEC